MTSPGTEASTAMSDTAQPPDLGGGPEGGESYGGAPEPPPNLTSNRRLQQTQAEVDQVVDILRDTVTKTIERDVILSSLDDKADALHESSKVFENSTTALARKYWCQDMKMMIILGVICGIVAIAIVVPQNEATVFSLKRPFSLGPLEGQKSYPDPRSDDDGIDSLVNARAPQSLLDTDHLFHRLC